MQLPGQLAHTTLGDLLGALHRDEASGVLELIEPSGQRHHIDLRQGEVEHVETERGGPLLGDLLGLLDLPAIEDDARLGETLLAQGIIDEVQLAEALKSQTLARLERLFSIQKAAVRFHAPRPQDDDPTAPAPLKSTEFLRGRPRFKRRTSPPMLPPFGGNDAWAVLGLRPGATREDIRKAFRELAQQHHPDRHPGVDEPTKLQLFRKFAEISRAYHSLCS